MDNAVTLYLEPWQKRMLRDYFRAVPGFKPERIREVVKIQVDFRKKYHLNSYRVPVFKLKEELVLPMYLSEAQRAIMQECTGMKAVDTVLISPSMLTDKTIILG